MKKEGKKVERKKERGVIDYSKMLTFCPQKQVFKNYRQLTKRKKKTTKSIKQVT